MRIQRYIAKDMRSALAQVRETLGPDAVILSSGRIGDEVEVVAAMDMEVARAVESAPPATRVHDRESFARNGTPAAAPAAAPATEPRHAELLKNRRSSSQLSESLAPVIQAPAPAAPAAPVAVPPAAQAAGQDTLVGEMKDMRRMLEAQLATLAWNDLSRRSPVQAAMLKELAQLGITQDLANSLVRKLPAELTFSAARRFALATVARTIQVTGDRWLEKGGIVAFAGPAGAGKTTLLAKLAARWVLRHGPRRVAIISADAVRIGAHEQMHMLGRLLGVTTHNVYDVAELPELLYELRGCQFVMIDTAGASPRDPELARRLRLLNQMQASIETSLVLPASTQAGAIDEVVQRFELAKPSSCVITKVDEAVSLGGVLSALVRHKLPAAYISDGQRVPEDLSPARSHVLVSRAVEIASHNGSTADDEVMQRRMSGVRNAGK
ncbi:MAG TPA: flagellar biosynthesis protein FlhF [Steroidobacteraceae bacterium]|jgi:flagellar biosynthesis protein FlhF|nr:flagellar biosynthesis protein FlhF [Steroidobacteraceae bacterium]